jgi:hypothetical protein
MCVLGVPLALYLATAFALYLDEEVLRTWYFTRYAPHWLVGVCEFLFPFLW